MPESNSKQSSPPQRPSGTPTFSQKEMDYIDWGKAHPDFIYAPSHDSVRFGLLRPAPAGQSGTSSGRTPSRPGSGRPAPARTMNIIRKGMEQSWQDIQPYSRCIECNAELKDLPKVRARNLVTPFVYEKADAFSLCPSCGKVFWKGTHHKDMEVKLEEIMRKKEKVK